MRARRANPPPPARADMTKRIRKSAMNATTRKTVRRRLVQQPLLLPTHFDRVDHLAHKHVD